jgi:hypothetical protein
MKAYIAIAVAIFGIVMLLALDAKAAAWPNAWSKSGVSSGAKAVIVVVGTELATDISPPIACNSPLGCTITVLGIGTGTVQIRVQSANDATVDANYTSDATTLATNGKVLDFAAHRSLKLEFVAPPSAAGVIMVSGN